MPVWLARVNEKLGRWQKAFLLTLLLYLPLNWIAPQAGITAALYPVLWFFGLVAAFQLIRQGVRHALWRLRNRLLVAYVFIAVVPIVLILALVTITAWLVIGQVAVYVVNSRLEDRIAALSGPVGGFAGSDLARRRDRIQWAAPYLEGLFPGVEVVVRDSLGPYHYPPSSALENPPEGWGDKSGIVVKDGKYYFWSHFQSNGAVITAVAPLSDDGLSNLVPGIGDVRLLTGTDIASSSKGGLQVQPLEEPLSNQGPPPSQPPGPGEKPPANHIPPKANLFDFLVYNGTVVSAAVWDAPGKVEQHLIGIQTRPSAVLRLAYSQRADVGTLVLGALAVLAILFLLVELLSLVIGINFTRTITRAVHNLYEGTLRVQRGDFSHRIQVRGKDQLGELSLSFNEMTETVERLLSVEKEQQRLKTDLEIAQKVQSELFPREMPKIEGLELFAQCNPANLVSGDYYDFIKLDGHGLAVAFGDVAGKGISAALLMAAVQSTMRVQVNTHFEINPNGAGGELSPAQLVSRLNIQLYNHTSPEKFSTFYFGLYDERRRLLTYTNAGHLPPILVRRGEVIRLEVNGMVVGAFPFSQFGQSSIELEPGDLLVCYTDGVTEPENEYGEMFGEDRLVELIQRGANLPPEELIASVTTSVLEWTGSPQLQDDMTVLVARQR